MAGVKTIDEVLYSLDTSTALYSDDQEYQEAQDTFQFSETGKEFEGTVWWQEWLSPLLENNAATAAAIERAYDGLPGTKADELRLNRIKADYALKLVRGLVEEAVSFPRPIFRKEES